MLMGLTESRNHKCSIYTRLWCAYEAHLASEEGKVVLIARAPYNDRLLAAMPAMAAAAISGILLGIFIRIHELEGYTNLFCIIAIISTLFASAAWHK